MGNDSFVFETQSRHTSRRRPKHPQHVNRNETTAPILCIWDMTHSCMRYNPDTHSGDGPNILPTSTGRRQRRPNYVYGTWRIRICDSMHTHTQEAARTSAAGQQDKDDGARIIYMGHDSSVYYAGTYAGGGPGIRRTSTGRRHRRHNSHPNAASTMGKMPKIGRHCASGAACTMCDTVVTVASAL